MKKLISTILLVVLALFANTSNAKAQNDLIVGQYIHNQFAINPAFAGSREGLTFFGSWRKQWTGIENTPTSILFSCHTPLKKENIIIGLQGWNQQIHQASNTGIELALGYRFNVAKNTWVGLALLPGVSIRSTDWTKVKLIDEGDDVFAENTSNTTPLLGFGASVYNQRFFFGLSATSLFISDEFDRVDAEFAPADAQYIATGGGLIGNGQIKVQPSVMASYSKKYEADVTGTLSVIWKDFIWVDGSYSTKNEISAGVAVQALPQMRIAYNYGVTTGDLSGYSRGSHEISIQYDLVYKVKTVNPRFF
ncbi:MAG: PorP/SprF family type IX secretion system membrane protein [Bacteroidales bacterium]|nr:PorP/SprF family type IX secretion system membrane protein [Bacteroidales bacterium]